jgi:hypothetical protein
MNDSLRRHPTHAPLSVPVSVIGLAFLGLTAACGSGATSPAEGTRASNDNAAAPVRESHETRTISVPVTTAAGTTLTPVEVNVTREAPPPFLCPRDPIAFDLSLLRPTDGTPVKFWYAWAYARRHQELPGFVITYYGTATGPFIEAQAGAVRPVRTSVYTFMDRLTPTYPERVDQDPSDPFRVTTTVGRTPFMTAFGAERQREGFFISSLTVQGHLDVQCQSLRDVVVTMKLPLAENRGQRFGNMTVDEALGPAEDGGWTIAMAAQSLDSLPFQP